MSMDDKRRVELSKLLALLLRHRAAEHGLALDPEGFVPLADVVAAINGRPGWDWVRPEHIAEVITQQEKRRYEIVEDDIRAIYGHSVSTAISYPAVEPPEHLLHGTARRFVETILREGLRPMSRQYVHLTDDPALARLTGRRRDSAPAILRIDAARAHADDVAFYRADNGVFLAKEVPPQYISPDPADGADR
jgi:putative RNA 2'-phosphotransferase